MPSYVYIKERRDHARREKTPYQAINYWIKASGAVRVNKDVQGVQAVFRFQGARIRVACSAAAI
ncbi:MAG: hypothetical protein Q8K12_13105 [Thiobacillus sp.]|nr:hypothetical protein [Thiobacillus sp.]